MKKEVSTDLVRAYFGLHLVKDFDFYGKCKKWNMFPFVVYFVSGKKLFSFYNI
jgi:hypothetical protein